MKPINSSSKVYPFSLNNRMYKGLKKTCHRYSMALPILLTDISFLKLS